MFISFSWQNKKPFHPEGAKWFAVPPLFGKQPLSLNFGYGLIADIPAL
jgi:hypothetical protein